MTENDKKQTAQPPFSFAATQAPTPAQIHANTEIQHPRQDRVQPDELMHPPGLD